MVDVAASIIGFILLPWLCRWMRLRYTINFDASLESCSVPLVMRFGSSFLFSIGPGAEPIGSRHLIKLSSEFVFNSQT